MLKFANAANIKRYDSDRGRVLSYLCTFAATSVAQRVSEEQSEPIQDYHIRLEYMTEGVR